MPNLRTYSSPVRIMAPQVAGQATVLAPLSGGVDMQGFDGIEFILLLNSVAATGNCTVTAQDSPDGVTFTTITTLPFGGVGGVLTGPQAPVNVTVTNSALGTADANKLLILDVFRPLQRFVRFSVVTSVANIAIDGGLAVRYAAKRQPPANDTTVSTAVFAVANS